jgi:phospholipid transport system substrate-binding protein
MSMTCFNDHMKLWSWLGLVIALMLAMMAAPRAGCANQGEAAALTKVKHELSEALTILHNRSMPVEERRRALRQLAEQDLDLRWMAEATIRDHWSQLSPSQRDEFVKLFTGFIEQIYLNKIQDYVDLNIVVDRARAAAPGYAEVDGTVTNPDKSTDPITFRLEQSPRGWLVYDVALDGVSMVGNYRAQFDRVIQDHGVDQLLNDLRAKQKQLASDG